VVQHQAFPAGGFLRFSHAHVALRFLTGDVAFRKPPRSAWELTRIILFSRWLTTYPQHRSECPLESMDGE
jgi:hypothetical protein